MKHVLFFTDTPLFGGAENQMFLLAKFLDRAKFRVTFVCLKTPHLDHLCEKLTATGVDVIRLPFSSKHDPRIFRELVKILTIRHVDLLHLHLWNPASCRYGFLAGNRLKITMIVTEHDPFELSPFKKVIKKWLTKNVRAVIAISRSNAEFLKKIYPAWAKKIFLIHNGIDVAEWGKSLPAVSKQPHGEMVVLNVGTLHERKGQDILIRACAELLQWRPEIRLVLAGEGPERKNLEKLAERLGIQEHVTFIGQHADIPALLKTADVFVYPSRREAFGMALLEAGLAKLPVVASNVGGIPELIEDGKTGLLFENENAGNLASTLEKLFVHENFMKSLPENLFHKVKSQFSAEAMAKATEKIYDRVLSHSL